MRAAPAVVAILLVALILLVFAQSAGFSFINFDDDYYVSNNPVVQKGLTTEGIGFAFSIRNGFYWHPLTWLTLMAECSLAGPNPTLHHAVNVALHAATVLLVFLFLLRATGCAAVRRRRRCSGCTRCGRSRSPGSRSVRTFCSVASQPSRCCFTHAMRSVPLLTARVLWPLTVILALLSKPAAVTLPILLLIADYWPLRRPDRWQVLVCEKLPLLACSTIVASFTWIGQEAAGALALMEQVPLHIRVLKAAEWLWGYVAHTFWPVGLVIPYPYDRSIGAAGVCWVATATATAGTFAVRRAHPYLLAGWLWFVLALMPSLGFVQAGGQSMADRFTYLPHVGFFAGFVWLAAEQLPVNAFRYGAVVVILAAAWTCARQVSLWRDSVSLFSHTIEHTPDNWVARLKLGSALMEKGDYTDAIVQLREAVRQQPASFHTHYNLGRALAAVGNHTEAASAFSRAITLRPTYADAHYSLGAMLLQTGRAQAAETALRQAITLGVDPRYMSEAHNLLGASMAQQGRIVEALPEFERAADIDPANMNARRNLQTARQAIAAAPGTPVR